MENYPVPAHPPVGTAFSGDKAYLVVIVGVDVEQYLLATELDI